MADFIERLRASKLEYKNAKFKEGFEAGQDWAKETANYEELKSLMLFRDKIRDHEWSDFFEAGESAFTPAERLAMEILGESFDRSAASEFWESVIGEDWERTQNESEFLRGFVEGSLEIFAEFTSQA